jgi:hypothetical protein
MTQQFPLFLAATAQQQQEHAKAAPRAMGLAVTQLPQLPMAAPFAQQDLMAWLLAGSKMGQLPGDLRASGPGHLALDAAGLATELNAGRCGSPDHVVPQAPGSPSSTLDRDWRSPQPPAAASGEEARESEAPHTPELQPRDPAPTPPLKRKWFDYEHAPIAPRTHRRKALHPMRAAEAVADDWDTRFSPARSSTPPLLVRRHDHHRRSPERIHRKPAAPKSRPGTPASGSAGNVAKECHDCHTLKTPMWRRVDGVTYCNACGLRRTRALVGR